MLLSNQSGLYNILLVEDEEDIRELFMFFFEDTKYNLMLASNGEEAINKLKEHEFFDLIISDVQMPIMSGAELLRNIRSLKGIKQPKFLFMTGALNNKLNEEFGDQFDGIIYKPFKKDEILAKIQTIFPQ